MAPGYEGSIPEAAQLREGCNLGYATACPRFPAERAWDAVRFAVTREHESRVWVSYVCEKDYLPGEHGVLEYSLGSNRWTSSHPDARVQRLAECFLDSWRCKTPPMLIREGPAAVPDEAPNDRT